MRFQDFSGGDKRDRTADLMTASCDRFVISGDFEYNTSVPSTNNTEFHSNLSTASTRFRAHLGHNLGQGSGEIWRSSAGVDVDCNLSVADSQVVKGMKLNFR